MSADGLGVATRQAIFNPQICADRPTKLPQALLENRLARLDLWIVRGEGNEHADAPRPFGLRSCRKRPADRRAAEHRDELAALDHSITSSARASSAGGTPR